jgi:60 kDa SS-A/Ro ribonucleoprotein
MATLNKVSTSVSGKTHEGGVARKQTPERELERSVMACLLWEDTFYESGESIADRIAKNVAKVKAETVLQLADKARNQMYLRHVPLLLAREMARLDTHKPYVRETLNRVIKRADELTEFLAIYWKDKKQPLSNQVKKGLADAFTKFSEYDLAKYNRDKDIKLRDVLFLSHAKPKDAEQAALWKRLINDELAVPDTWEVAISAAKGNDAKVREEWTRLLVENKLGGLALLRNLRNMMQAGVDKKIVREAIQRNNFKMVLPFRFFAAAQHVQAQWGLDDVIEDAMLRACQTLPKLQGTTALLVDNSGSMQTALSQKSDLTRSLAARALGVLVREVCEEAIIVAFGTQPIRIKNNLRGAALSEAILKANTGWSTYVGAAVDSVKKDAPDRTIVITDEQGHDKTSQPHALGYMLNVASYQPSIAYGKWTSMTGFSENLVRYIAENEGA